MLTICTAFLAIKLFPKHRLFESESISMHPQSRRISSGCQKWKNNEKKDHFQRFTMVLLEAHQFANFAAWSRWFLSTLVSIFLFAAENPQVPRGGTQIQSCVYIYIYIYIFGRDTIRGIPWIFMSLTSFQSLWTYIYISLSIYQSSGCTAVPCHNHCVYSYLSVWASRKPSFDSFWNLLLMI